MSQQFIFKCSIISNNLDIKQKVKVLLSGPGTGHLACAVTRLSRATQTVAVSLAFTKEGTEEFSDGKAMISGPHQINHYP